MLAPFWFRFGDVQSFIFCVRDGGGAFPQVTLLLLVNHSNDMDIVRWRLITAAGESPAVKKLNTIDHTKQQQYEYERQKYHSSHYIFDKNRHFYSGAECRCYILIGSHL